MSRLSAATTRAARTTRNTRNGPTALQTRLVSLLREARWILFAALAAWLTLVLLTGNPADPGWSHSSQSSVLQLVAGAEIAYRRSVR